MGPSARVLILSAADAVTGPLAEGLDRLGWRTVTARTLDAALTALGDFPIEAAVVDCVSGAETGVAAELRAAVKPHRLPVIALAAAGGRGDFSSFDLVLPAHPHPAQAALRLEQSIRAAVAEEEFGLRRDTFGEKGVHLDSPSDPSRPARILVVGEPAPAFLALSNALQETDAEVVAAFTAYTAFDYLHERPFDAVVLWGGDDQASALAIAGGMRRNTKLYHVPTLLYLRANADLNLSEAYNRGITDVAAPDVPEAESAGRIMALARAYRRQSAVREALEKVRGSGLMDAATGLFTRDLFATHLARLGRAAQAVRRPLSVCVLKVAERPEVAKARQDGFLDKAMPQIGSMIARLVRAEDTAARLSPEVFALALPATGPLQARLVGERIAAVLGCTAFEAGEGEPPFVVEFDVGVAKLEPGQTAADALQAAAEFSQREAG
ncbi:MAG: diguanylate cyclase [Caulobacteraceae bacterium]|nr:diguanylate cyclase [Caulobacteraceae bacterium]